MTGGPKISVVTPTLNQGRFLEKSILSVVEQGYPNLEYILIDGGSTDETLQIIEKYEKHLAFWASEPDRGQSHAINKGFARATGELCVWLNSDDYFTKDALFIVANAFQQYPRVGAIVGGGVLVDDDGRIIPHQEPPSLSFDALLRWGEGFFCQPSCFFTRKAWLECGPLDEGLHFAMDLDLWLKMAARHTFVRIEPTLSVSLVHSLAKSAAQAKRQQIEAAMIITRHGGEDRGTNHLLRFVQNLDDERRHSELHYRGLLEQKDHELEALRNLAAELKAQERAFRESTSWRLTAPLRKINDFRVNLLSAKRGDERTGLAEPVSHKVRELLQQLEAWEQRLPAMGRLRLTSILRRLNQGRKRMLTRFEEWRHRVVKVHNARWPADLPLVSVVIPCFNYGEYVEEAINSVLGQTFQDFEIIVVDGGSTDERTLLKLRELNKPMTRVLFRQERHLVGSNRNHGIAQARGKYICCLDADDSIKPTYLEKALFLCETYHYDIAYPWVQCHGDSDELWAPSETDLLGCVQGQTLSTVALFRKEAWERVGGYRDWGVGKDHVPEDWDFWIRLLGHGYRSRVLPETLMSYRVHDRGLTAENQKSVAEQRAILRAANADLLTEENLRLVRERQRVRYLVDEPFRNLEWKAKDGPEVLLALPFMITGGADTVLLQVVEHLVQHGMGVSCTTSFPFDGDKHGDNTAHYEKLTKAVYHLPRFLPNRREWKDFLFYLIQSRGVDVVLIVGCEVVYSLLPELKSRFPRLRVIDQLFNEFGHFENNRKYADFIDLNIVASRALGDILTRQHGEKECRIEVIVHGVDVRGAFNPALIADSKALETLGVPSSSLVVGFFGRFSEEKCPAAVVDIAHALKEFGDIHFLMTGGGPLHGEVKDRAAKLGLAGRITAPGIVEDIRPLLKSTDVVVIPSRIEGIPIILMEALSMGIPVIASRVGGIPSVIEDGVNGFLCEPGDVDGFARKIAMLHSNRALRLEMARSAREYAVNHLDVRQMKDAYLASVRGVLNNRGE